MRLTNLGLMAGAILLSACQTMTPVPPAPAASLAIAHVTVIDPQTRRVLPDRTVLVAGDTIVAVQPGSRRAAAARTIDGRGKFLIPGLADMHIHLFLPEPAAPNLALLLANGVTSIREMSSDCWAVAGQTRGCIADYRRLQSELRAGTLPGPDIVGLTSTMVMGPTRSKRPSGDAAFVVPATAGDGRQVAEWIVGRGVDLLKTHDSIPAAALAAMMAEAKARGLAVGGHLPFAVGSVGAARMGFRSIEHARDLLYDCSRFGPEFRRREAAVVEGVAGARRPSNLERLRGTVDQFDPAICAAMLRELAQTGAYYVPTHVTREMEARADDTAYRADAARRFIFAGRNANWEKDLAETAALPGAERTALRDFFRHGLRITGLAHRAGVPVMAGTDASDTMIVPGFSLHRELGLLRAAGLSPMDVLRSATSVPAAYLRREHRMGGIAAGKEADLVLLDANPLVDVGNASRIAAVVTNGRLYDRAALDRLLASAEAAAAASRR